MVFVGFWFAYERLCLGGYGGGPQAGVDIGINSRATTRMNFQPGTGTAGVSVFIIRLGVEGVTGVGTSTGYMNGTDTYYPRIEWTPSLGTFNFIGTGSYPVTIQMNGLNLALMGSLSSYIEKSGGSGSQTTLENPTFAGGGTITATFGINGLVITPAEWAMVDGATTNIPNQITATQGTISAHTHTGNDGTTQIPHSNLGGAGTNSHATIDTFVASKAQASGLASLDASSKVVQNPTGASQTPGTNTIVMTGTNTTTIADAFLSDNITKLGTPTTDNVSEGSTNKYYTDARVNAAAGSLTVGSRANELITSVIDGHHFVYNSALGKWINATSTASIAWSGITDDPLGNGSVSVTGASGKIPLGSTSGKLDPSWIPGVIRLTPDTGTPTSDANGYLRLTTNTAVVANKPTLLLHGNGTDTSRTITNSASGGIVIHPAGDAQIDTAQSALGGASILYDGTTDFIAGSDTASVLLNQDFQLDVRVRYNSTTGQQNIYYHQSGGADLNNFTVTGAGVLKFFVDSGGAGVVDVSYAWSPSINIWYALRVALDASENTYYLWVDGNLVRTVVDTDKPANYTEDFFFGRGSVPTESNFNGWMDEVRLKVGTGSVETTGTYTVSVSEFATGADYDESILRYTAPQGVVLYEIKNPGTETTAKSIVAINATTTIFGSLTSAYSGSSTVYTLDASAGNLLVLSVVIPSTIESKIIADKGTRSRYLADIRELRIEKGYRLSGNKISDEDAENNAKYYFLADEYNTWKTQHIGSYTTVIGTIGSQSTVIDYAKMGRDYKAIRELDWMSFLGQQEKIKEVIFDVEADKNQPIIGAVVGDPSTPDYMHDGNGRRLENEIGAMQLAVQELIAIIDNQQIEITNLKKIVSP